MTLFIPTSFDGLPRHSGSIRLRCQWPARYWDGAEVYSRSQRFAGHDLYIFQKAYRSRDVVGWIETAARWRDDGKCRLALDLCDPDFLDEEHRRRLLRVLPLFDFAVATTNSIREWLQQWLPAYLIPDRVDLHEIDSLSHHIYTDRRTPRLVWAGYEANMGALELLLPTIHRLKLQIEILSVNRPMPFADFWSEVVTNDILLNPRPNCPPYTYKSDNKTLIAWALGMPVARTGPELERLCDPGEREREIDDRRVEVVERWDVRTSVTQWKNMAARWCHWSEGE